jgi:NADP-dependent 3-hydroxy acid dehydrogenase YdfG
MASKVIIVTGASRGIGLAVAKYLINGTHKVVLASRSEQELAALKSQFPDQVEYMAADLCNFDVSERDLHITETY